MGDQESRAGTSYSTKAICSYCDEVHAPQGPALQSAFDAPNANAMPEIMVGQSEARFLSLLVQLTGAEKIVEVGTLAGYSAISMAQSMSSNGHLWSIENEPIHADVARRHIAEAGLSERITVICADGLDGLAQVVQHGPFDMVFLDADKERYDQYQAWAETHLRFGGVLLADNAYYFGQLLDETEDAAAVRRMHEQTSLKFDSVCIPTPDGLVMGLKTRQD